MKPWVAFLCLQLAMIAPQMCRCEPARGRIVGLLEHWATCANTPEVQAYNQLAQIVYEHVGSPLAGLGVYDPGSVNAQWGRDLGETALFVAALEGTRSQINWQPGRVGRAGGTALRAQPLLPENAESLAAKNATPSGHFYSVAFETRLNPSSYPGVSRARHFQEANENLLRAMEADASFAQMMQQGGVNLQRTATGLAPRTPPPGWTWHHAQESGVMQLVPHPQLTRGSIFWDTMHPGGQGGYSIWGQ